MIRFPGSSVVLLALVASGCDTSQAPCRETCPDISGVYSIESTTPAGECGFSPYLLPPSVRLEQTRDGRGVLFHVIDPTTQIEVPLSGDVYAPESGEEGLLGSFRIDSRTTRLARSGSDQLVTLDVTVMGSVSQVEDRRVLTATVNTTDAASNQGCTATLSVMGESR
ncbi:hypothetical protein CYFUS_000036 [Cystobacter fuscus]|uniref:Lipoprotein n=1 Tax=Cystobacter fuscus TaxID=43 RepID=A0A250ISB5_9BACT|nr:hypothetical protein [Cystobacter fuscus]ATB34629.1 hypothetical protein CYFUS_000036 [Cystobacter fuscus]